MIKKIISGGQTGADIAGIDAAITHHIPYGGYLPKGRRNELGTVSLEYANFDVMTRGGYPMRTEQNVIDSDGTVIFTHGKLKRGGSLTRRKAQEHDRPFIHLDMSKLGIIEAIAALATFIEDNGIEVLNVAGTRASKDEAIYDLTYQVIEEALIR